MVKAIRDYLTFSFPSSRAEDWEEATIHFIKELPPCNIDINCSNHILNYKDLKKLYSILQSKNITINSIKSNHCETIISASSLGIQTHLILQEETLISNKKEDLIHQTNQESIVFHQGTVRAGEHIEAENNLLLLGDVNPGGRLSAGGDVMVWGKLRGIAHAGKAGNSKAKIVALQLRPLQLRISNKVARGPDEQPQEGLAEEAILKNGQIIIQPAKIGFRDPSIQ